MPGIVEAAWTDRLRRPGRGDGQARYRLRSSTRGSPERVGAGLRAAGPGGGLWCLLVDGLTKGSTLSCGSWC